jgi:hypothetical protein
MKLDSLLAADRFEFVRILKHEAHSKVTAINALLRHVEQGRPSATSERYRNGTRNLRSTPVPNSGFRRSRIPDFLAALAGALTVYQRRLHGPWL